MNIRESILEHTRKDLQESKPPSLLYRGINLSNADAKIEEIIDNIRLLHRGVGVPVIYEIINPSLPIEDGIVFQGRVTFLHKEKETITREITDLLTQECPEVVVQLLLEVKS